MELPQLRKALSELNGEREAVFGICGMSDVASVLTVSNAMLIPDEGDELVKVTDGKSIYIFEADMVVWVKIALSSGVETK